jgi:8-oxo-dGTP pyrophosphatase MutT (NUDIX family)
MARNKPRDDRAALGNDNRASIHSRLPVSVRRVGYKLAYTGLRAWWLVRRPRVSGVKCVLTYGDLVLLVKHTYGHRGWDFPGGSLKRGEAPQLAASREMSEELGVGIDDWALIGRLVTGFDHRREQIHCFRAELPDPSLELDRGELDAADWFPRDHLPSDLGRYVRPILEVMEDRPTPIQ